MVLCNWLVGRKQNSLSLWVSTRTVFPELNELFRWVLGRKKKNAKRNADCGSQGNKVSEKNKDSFGNLVTEHSHCTLVKKLAKSYLCPENMTEAELKSD